jgi:RNA polymerase sigma-70 factor (ECF subfamily)
MRRDLVQRAMVHDHEAFTELARLAIDKLYAIARLILHDEERADDAVQEALVGAWRDIAALRDPDRFEVWLRRLLIHACYREARRDRARGRMEVHVEVLDPHAPDVIRQVADRDQLEHAFRHLSPEQRALIVLHYYVGLPVSETADVLGLPVGTIKSRLHRTTQAMRATLDAESRGAGLLGKRPA